MAVHRPVTGGNDGALTEHPQSHTVICWDRLADQTGTHGPKGRLLSVEGRRRPAGEPQFR
jgi:hypothetical protein